MTNLADVGRRLRAHRIAARMPIDAAARTVKVSRALLYRYEAGGIVKLDILDRLARLYGTSATALLGLGQEYIVHSVTFFERLEKLEQEADHITTVFGPLAYVLSTDAYEEALVQALPDAEMGEALSASELQRLRRALRRRRAIMRERRPGFVNIIPVAEIANYLATGATGAAITVAERQARRRQAAKEMEHLASLIAKPPIGVQIALTPRPLPTAGFQILRTGRQKLLVTSPFRLGEPINLRYGVAVISGDEQALRLHESLVARLWDSALTGGRAIDEIERLLKAARAER
jgi:transcriptional regulator with XRE-family HTH domain